MTKSENFDTNSNRSTNELEQLAEHVNLFSNKRSSIDCDAVIADTHAPDVEGLVVKMKFLFIVQCAPTNPIIASSATGGYISPPFSELLD